MFFVELPLLIADFPVGILMYNSFTTRVKNLQCVWQRFTRSVETQTVFQLDPWFLLGGITHHKRWLQNMCHTHSWPQQGVSVQHADVKRGKISVRRNMTIPPFPDSFYVKVVLARFGVLLSRKGCSQPGENKTSNCHSVSCVPCPCPPNCSDMDAPIRNYKILTNYFISLFAINLCETQLSDEDRSL